MQEKRFALREEKFFLIFVVKTPLPLPASVLFLPGFPGLAFPGLKVLES